MSTEVRFAMTALPTFSRRARWLVPVGAVAVAGAVTAGSMISVAQASPELPARTPAQLLAAVAGQTTPPPAFTGTVVETANLGIPQLPGLSNQNSPVSLLAGNHTVNVWYASPQRFRLSVPVQMSETDLIRNGRQAWMWQSSSNSVTRMQLPAKSSAQEAAPAPTSVPLTPQQAASQALKAVGPSTNVTVQRTATVAGQAAYQLSLSPKSSGSLIRRVTIAIDAAKNVPLRVQVFARGAGSPAFQVGFDRISFVRPAASNFSFTPPHGATVKTVTGPTGGASQHQSAHQAGQGQVIGQDWLSVAVLPASALNGLTSMAGAAAGQSVRSVAPGAGGSGESAAIAGALLGSARAVHGTWGSGRLLRTSLISVLITSSGHVLVGAVTPAVLYHAAASVK
jgi:outer membrane lipoprotein-sorting protein